MRLNNSKLFFVAITFILIGVITYFGFRTIAHEALLRQYQQQTLAKSRTEQVENTITALLDNKAIRLLSMINYLKIDNAALNDLIAKDSQIDALFILQKNQLLFPNSSVRQTQQEKAWMQSLQSIISDPTQLYSHYFIDEQSHPTSGWFISHEQGTPLLIYWINQNNILFGFKLSYVGLLADVINQLDVDPKLDALTVKDDGRLLYQSGNLDLLDDSFRLNTQTLTYPLNRWQIDYYGQQTQSYTLYIWGGLLILLIILMISLVIYRFYQEYTRTVRLASQQVSFVSQVSHELKTPLTNINLYAEMLKEEPFDEQSPALRYLDVITSESQRLSRLIQNILTFTNTPKVHLQSIDINEVLAQIYRTFTPAFNSKGIILNLQIENDITLMSDLDRLIQIISNFLSNAEKYASQGGRVDLIAQSDERAVYIRVRDYGAGIAVKEHKSIFQPFYRIKSSLTEGVSGTGIGLTIALQLANSLDGEIQIENKTPGVQFTLRLPLSIT